MHPKRKLEKFEKSLVISMHLFNKNHLIFKFEFLGYLDIRKETWHFFHLSQLTITQNTVNEIKSG